MNIGFIGCGNIANFHADVLKFLKKELTAAADNNFDSLKQFQIKYNVKSGYYSWKEMLEKESLDAIWVTVSWNVVDNLLLDILSYGIPTFFEKPVALTPEKIETAINHFPKMIDKVQVGYNRRFYDFIPLIKLKLDRLKINAIEVHIPESISGNEHKTLLKYLFLQNSSHVIDLLYFLLGESEIEVIKVFRQINSATELPNGYNGLLRSKNIPIHLIANWNSSTNFGIKFHSDGVLVSLLPIEIATIYYGFEIIEPTRNNPVRQYIPKIKSKYFIENESAQFKPGFLKQAINFFNTCVENKYKNTQASNLESALYITKLCKEIM